MAFSENQVKAVLFDLGGTLVTISNHEIPHVMKKALQHCGIIRSLEEITYAWKQAERGLDFRDLTKLLDEFWVLWNRRILGNLQVNTEKEDLAKFIATYWWDYSDISLYPDAQKILPILKEEV